MANLLCENELHFYRERFYMSFKVSVPASGHEFSVEQGETILEAALRHGIGLPYGCRNGACGKCAGELISGEVEYAKELSSLALEQQQQGKILLCQACPQGDIEIKVREISTGRDLEIKTLPCRVESMQLLTHDIMKIELKLPETERLQFLAGQRPSPFLHRRKFYLMPLSTKRRLIAPRN